MSSSAADTGDDARCLIDTHDGVEPYFQLPEDAPAWHKAIRPSPRRVVDDTKQRAHTMPMTWGNLKRVYPDAIELGSDTRDGTYRKIFVWFFIVISAFLLVFVGGGMAALFLSMPGLNKLGVVMPILLIVGGGLVISMMYRGLPLMDMYAAQLFNRKTRKVIFVARTPARFWKPFEKSQLVYSVESWDNMHVRSYKTQVVGQGSYQVQYQMRLLFEHPLQPKVAGSMCSIGGASYSDDYLFQLYEYVRRYMEEGAPPVGVRCVPNITHPPPTAPFKQADIDAAGGRALTHLEILAMLDEQSVPLEDDLRDALSGVTRDPHPNRGPAPKPYH